MKKSTFTTIATLALATTITLSSWADPDEDSEDNYVSTENIDQPFGDESGDYTESHLSIFPLGHHHRKGEDSNLRIVNAPLVTVFRAKKDEDEHRVDIVNVPFFKLAKTKSNSDGEFDNKFVKLPIVGSLFRHKREGDREKIRFLIFSHTRKVDPDEYGKDPYKKATPAIRSRGKGGLRRN